jgi:sugar phosphate isomerase/epimerase
VAPSLPAIPQATVESCVLTGRGGGAHQPTPSSSGSGGAANNLGLWEPGGIDFDTVFRGLHEIGYTGYFTVHSRTSQANTPVDLATETFAFLKPYAGGTKG